MDSPFPGMDPYLEAQSIWADAHTSLVSRFRERLTPLLVPKYLAELETQVVIDHFDENPQVVLPDIRVTSPDVAIAGVDSRPGPLHGQTGPIDSRMLQRLDRHEHPRASPATATTHG